MNAIAEKYGHTGELIFENAVEKLIHGETTVEEAMDYIMEFARGDWRLTVDENLESLAVALSKLRYSVEKIPKGTSDDEIRREYNDEVFVTSNDRDFTLDEVPKPFRRGMILVPNGIDAQRLARRIEKLLMNWRSEHPAEPVKFRIERGDLG